MKNEIFILGDPRFLAGGAGMSMRFNYSCTPIMIAPDAGDDDAIWSETVAPMLENGVSVPTALKTLGQNIHSGKTSYHNTPEYNVFLREDDPYPSCGVELETVGLVYTSDGRRRMLDDLHSNWLHIERDGSLDGDHGGDYGYEFITEPLPSRVYRDPRTWCGLQNILSPWVRSFDRQDTGLHVHVGIDRFTKCPGIPLPAADDRRAVGRALAMMTYYGLAPQSLVDRVTLRSTGGYCASPSTESVRGAISIPASGVSGAEFVDLAVETLMDGSSVRSAATACIRDDILARAVRPGADPVGATWLASCYSGCTGHSVEINAAPLHTLEFRRGKGTINGQSIHRMVEFMTGIVRFAEETCRSPGMKVCRQTFLDFIHDTTTSEALRQLIRKGN